MPTTCCWGQAVKFSQRKSTQRLDALWRESFQKGECLVGCKLRGPHPCEHLESWLKRRGERRVNEPHFFYTDTIEEFSGDVEKGADVTRGIWKAFKMLRRSGLQNHQILILLDRDVMGKSFRQMVEERGWSSYGTLHREYKKAIEFLRRKGVKREVGE